MLSVGITVVVERLTVEVVGNDVLDEVLLSVVAVLDDVGNSVGFDLRFSSSLKDIEEIRILKYFRSERIISPLITIQIFLKHSDSVLLYEPLVNDVFGGGF